MDIHFILRFTLFLWFCTIIQTYDSFNSKNTILRQLVVDDVSGNIYVGGDNRLCQLNPDLDLMYDVSLGPVMDNAMCIPTTAKLNPGHCIDPLLKLQQTDNIVKILVIDNHQSALIVCGNVYQGSCQMRNLQNIEELISFPTSQGHWVIANKGDNASFGFIAAGSSGTNVLYVGAAFAEADSALVILPSIAIRNVDKLNSEQMFKLYKDSVSDNTRTLSRSRSRTAHVIYNGGFASGQFRYFSMIKPVTPGSGLYKSRLTRICQQDDGDYRNKKLISYTEAPLECKKEGVNYQLIQAIAVGKAGSNLATRLSIVTHSDIAIALFAQAKENSAEATGDSAICIYTLKEIERLFDNKTSDCWNGNGFSGLSFDGQNNRPKCNKQTQPYSSCNLLSNSPLELDTPITKTAAFIIKGDTMLSLAVNSYDLYSIAFVGTSKGKLLKLLLESDKEISVFATNQVSTTKVDKVALSKDKNDVIAMAQDMLVKVPVSECGMYSNCSSCIASNNPYCGWCVLKNRCATNSECDNSDREIHWKRGKPAQCITIVEVFPTSAPANQEEMITLKVLAQLPVDEVYECVFEKHGNTPATVEQLEDGTAQVTCNTPILKSTIVERNMPVTLSLKASSNSEPFVTAVEPIMIYDCTIIDTCKECNAVGSPGSGCKWCPYDGGCIYQANQCNKGSHVTSSNVCPTLEYIQYFRIPVGHRKEFEIKGRHLPQPDRNWDNNENVYNCVVDIDGVKQTTRARLKDSSILVCEAHTYTYSGNKGVVVASVSAIFANVEIDKLPGLTVEVYKCNRMAQDCSQCQGKLNNVYQCSWCTATNQCTLHSDPCLSRLDSGDKTCPPPTVKSIYPVAGPIRGGTRVTIEGRNLGVEFGDIESIYVAEVQCNQNMYGDHYQVSTTVVCETGYSQTSNSGPIRITVRGLETVSTNAVRFDYLDPVITGIEPTKGPKSGGSAVTITGHNMNIGTSASVELGGVECTVLSRKENKIVCQTTRAGNPKKASIQLQVDKATIRSETLSYRFTPDPTISRIEPLCSHLSGGIDVTVYGTDLDAIQTARIIVDRDHTEVVDQTSSGECSPSLDNGRTMICKTPSVEYSEVSGQGVPVPIAFQMDKELVIRNLNDDTPASLKYYPDFTVDMWDNNMTTWTWEGSETAEESSHYLRISGNYLTLEQTVNVNVFVGNLTCAVTHSSTEQEILCSPPTLSELRDDQEASKQPSYEVHNNSRRKREPTLMASRKKEAEPMRFEVRVVLGNRQQSPGFLDYKVTSNAITSQGSRDIPMPVVLAVVGAIILLAVVVSLLIFKYRRNSVKLTEQSEVTKKKMQDLESQVARECKDAFTELQMMVMSDISPSGDLTNANLPFLDFTSYATKVLFPNVEAFHRSTNRFHAAGAGHNNHAAVVAGLKDFHTLLSSEPFVLNFIHTLEQQPTFNMKDRCNVASLLMVALCQRLDYVTYIMTRLLCNLMKRPQIKTSPHLFLRRTESVAEKFLSNWLTFCLYDYVKQVAGKPLFVLYRAIKTTIEAGPVDMVTYEARYALSEDKLLRQKIDYKTLNVFLQVEGGKMPVKVLDCDTITQAKSKLHDAWYKGTGVSRRVPVDSLELRLVGLHDQVVLRDEDSSNHIEGDWKRLNTLRHYKVCEGAVFAFSADSSSTNKFGHYMDSGTQFNSNPKLNRSTDAHSSNPKMSRRDSGSSCGYRLWHLSKSNTHSTIDPDQTTFVPEIYLTRLITTKGNLQQFVNELFFSIFSLSNGDVPPAIKFLFDLLDRQAAENGITDPDIIHTWKNNSIPLRYWINIIKNPEMILDVEKHPLVDSILSVIAQTYMESCSLSNHAFNTDSPSSKLLYAKELHDYKSAVRKFYSDIQVLPPVTDDKLYSSLPSTDNMQLNKDAALYDLAVYAHQYCYQIDETLQRNNCDELSKQFATVISYLQLYLIPSNT